MLKVYSCLAQEHDLGLLAVAIIICVLASVTAFSAFDQARQDQSRSRMWVALAGSSAGLGIWATHFVAMLAYQSRIPVGYDFLITLLSVAVAVVITSLGWTVALKNKPGAPLLGGAIIGAGTAAMHYIGMAAVEVAGIVRWDPRLVLASIVAGMALASLAVWMHARRTAGTRALPPLVLAVAICGLHLTGMGAVTIYPMGNVTVPVSSIESETLATIVTAAAFLILAVALGLILLERRLANAQVAEADEKAALAEEVLRGAAERERLTARLERQVEISNAAMDNMAQGLSMFDGQQRLIICNRRYADLYDMPAELLVEGTPLSAILAYLNHEHPDFSTVQTGTEAADSGVAVTKTEVRQADGRTVSIHRRPLPLGGWVSTHEDITDVRAAQERIAFLAAHDVLTDLPNRAAFTEELDRLSPLFSRGHQAAVLTIDLDRFKEVNDTLGHPIGDQILKETATRLRDIVRANDLVTRLGGDEFAILQGNIGEAAHAEGLAARVVERLSEPFTFDGHTVAIGASVGISLAPGDGVDGAELMKRSDLALYRAKAENRGTYRFFEEGMDSRLSERRQMETDLRAAIAEEQFEIHYQPLLDLGSGRIDCFEALLRWRHPERGLIQPLDFIGLAEESGLIIPIGEWVLRRACLDASSWPSDIRVAVNVSPAQFKRGDLIGMTADALKSANFEPSRLELEITESVLLNDEAWVGAMLDRLTGMGVRIVMDDFGTGYSSLSYLRSLPFTKIKIDRSFIADLSEGTQSLAIVQATIQLSEKLGMQTTAEGVETVQQFEILAAEGCTQVQGFHISRPIPAADVPALLDELNPPQRSLLVA